MNSKALTLWMLALIGPLASAQTAGAEFATKIRPAAFGAFLSNVLKAEGVENLPVRRVYCHRSGLRCLYETPVGILNVSSERSKKYIDNIFITLGIKRGTKPDGARKSILDMMTALASHLQSDEFRDSIKKVDGSKTRLDFGNFLFDRRSSTISIQAKLQE